MDLVSNFDGSFDITGLTREQVGFILMAAGQTKEADKHWLGQAGASIFEGLIETSALEILDDSDSAIRWGKDVGVNYSERKVDVDVIFSGNDLYNETGLGVG